MPRKNQPRTPPPDAQGAYTAWAQERMAARTGSLTPHSVEKYSAIWTSWCEFLVTKGCPWHAADAATMREFLMRIDARGHSQQKAYKASDVTKRRYWRLLSRIYIHAVAQGWVAFNPGAEIALDVPRSEHSVAAVMRPVELTQLRHDLARAAAEPDLTWQQMRDHALLAILLDVALTTSELCALRDDQVLEHSPSGSLVLRVDGQRPAQRRDLLLDSSAAALVRRWMAQRRILYPDPATRPAVLFNSRKRPGHLTPSGVFALIKGLISEIEREQGETVPHRGANVVRSSVIAEWLRQEVAVSDILARAGLDTPRALDRLVHVISKIGP